MGNAIKYSISTVLIVAGLTILTVGHWFPRAAHPGTPGVETGIINIPVDERLFDDHIAELAAVQNPDDPKILPLMVLTPKVCPPCVNNVAEYAGLLKKHDLFLEPTLIFLDDEKSMLERFILTSRLDLPYKILDAVEAGSIFSESRQNLIFVNPEEQTAFYNTVIPNIIISIDQKETQLDDVASLWETLFIGDDDFD